jgi:hypothetical protein
MNDEKAMAKKEVPRGAFLSFVIVVSFAIRASSFVIAWLYDSQVTG